MIHANIEEGAFWSLFHTSTKLSLMGSLVRETMFACSNNTIVSPNTVYLSRYIIKSSMSNVKTEELCYWCQCPHLEAVLQQGVEGGAELVQEDAAARGGRVGGPGLVLVQQQPLHRRVQGHEQP